MSFASWALQKALYASLAAYAPLMARISGIYDTPPQDAALPYVTIGEDVVSDASAKDMRSTDHRLALHVWARGPGKAEAKQILGMIEAALAAQSPSLEGFMLINLRHLQSTVLTDADGQTQHGIIEFRGRLCPL